MSFPHFIGPPPTEASFGQFLPMPAESIKETTEESSDFRPVDPIKLDASHREIIDKLQRQEMAERIEIDKEARREKEEKPEVASHDDHHHERRLEDLRREEEQLLMNDFRKSEDFRSDEIARELKLAREAALKHASIYSPFRPEPQHMTSQDDHRRAKEDLYKVSRDDPSSKTPCKDSPEATSDARLKRPSLLMQHGLLPKKCYPHPNNNNMYPRDVDDRAAGPLDFSIPGSPVLPRPSPPPSGGELMSGGHHWTFEEQFKQLYELSDDPKRREFLDDLFCFMQKRGTPVNRIPIMAKQVLDLHELFRLVVSKGGLVEVINKKLWREIAKGLNLPSSITSAAFTLRTQYMKYLYPYECEKLKLSNPAELQAAIDGNRRDSARRPSLTDCYLGNMPTLAPTSLPAPQPLNGFPGPLHPLARPLMAMAGPATPVGPASLNSGSDDEDRVTPLSRMDREALMCSKIERDARAMEAATRVMEDAQKRLHDRERDRDSRAILSPARPPSCKSNGTDEPPFKKPALEDDLKHPPPHMPPFPLLPLGPTANFKITSRGDGRGEFDNSMVVSMEINGIMYQGVLFAQAPPMLPVPPRRF